MRLTPHLVALPALLLAAACVPIPNAGEIEDVDMPFHGEAALAPGEGVVVLGAAEDAIGEDALADCLREELQGGDPPVRLVPGAEFRDALFPWFEFDTRPETEQELADVLARPGASGRIEALNLRHVLVVAGSTTEGETSGVEAVMAGMYGAKERSTLTATVMDVGEARMLGNASVRAVATGGVVHVMLYGVVVVPTTESTACEGLARQLGAAFTGRALPTVDPPRAVRSSLPARL